MKGYLEVFGLASCLKWECLQHVSEQLSHGFVWPSLEHVGDGAGYHTRSAFVCFFLEVIPSEPPWRVGYAFRLE